MAVVQTKEARSLSDLNILAANPPQYPEKPHEEKQEPLVLYISRVPGTRDVILSPFKPSEKNVSSEDVASSLYYIHLELPSQELVAPTFRADDAGSTSDGSASAMAIPRKPLPDNACPVTPDSASSSRLNLAAPVQESRQRGASMTSQDGFHPAVSSSLTNESYIPPSDSADLDRPRVPPGLQAPPARKPVGPRAMVPSMALSDSSPTSTTAPFDRFRSDSAASGLREVRDARHSYASRSPSPRKRSVASVPAGEPFALTLIRRDPGTGSQWNVGRVTSRQLELPQDEEQPSGLQNASSPPDGVSTSSPPINIHIENSGYAKFRRMPRRRSLEAAGLSVLAANAADDGPSGAEIGVFSRQLQMGYTRSLMSNLKDRFQKLETQISKKGHNRQDSDSSQEHSKENAAAAVGQPGPGMKPRGYTFTSPWDGKCDFRTGNGGRSVRCYHTPHDSQPSGFNPMLAEQGINLPRSADSALSELRFNLPSTELLLSSEQDGANGESKLRGHFAKLLRPSGGHDDEDDDQDDSVSPFDVNIGGERAGGGNRGNRAKLGKLIIYNEGLKMLDLLVAANVGVWWGAWERSF